MSRYFAKLELMKCLYRMTGVWVRNRMVVSSFRPGGPFLRVLKPGRQIKLANAVVSSRSIHVLRWEE